MKVDNQLCLYVFNTNRKPRLGIQPTTLMDANYLLYKASSPPLPLTTAIAAIAMTAVTATTPTATAVTRPTRKN